MTDELRSLRRELSRLASAALRRQGGAHPPAAELVAYAAGELQPAAAEAMLEHLAVCRLCTRLVVNLPAFDAAQPQEPDAAASDPETMDAWQELLRRLQPGTGPAGALVEESAIDAEPGEQMRASHPLRVDYALAACLAACLIGFPLWIALHGRSPVPPRIVPVNATERPLGPTQHPAAPPKALSLDAEAAALVLYLRAPQADMRVRVEIQDAAGKTSHPAAAAAIGPQVVLVLLTHEQLPPGDYRLLIFGGEAHPQQLLGDYPLRILQRAAR
jgi:hypothetical protein